MDRFLILHEEVEKTLIDQLGLHYLHAHQIATRAEEAAIHAQRITWKAYDRFMQKYVKRIGDERLTKVPEDLDLKPYRDYHDYDLLQRMQQHLARDKTLPATKKAELKSYAAAFREQLREQHKHEAPGEAVTRSKASPKKTAAARSGKASPKRAPAKRVKL